VLTKFRRRLMRLIPRSPWRRALILLVLASIVLAAFLIHHALVNLRSGFPAANRAEIQSDLSKYISCLRAKGIAAPAPTFSASGPPMAHRRGALDLRSRRPETELRVRDWVIGVQAWPRPRDRRGDLKFPMIGTYPWKFPFLSRWSTKPKVTGSNPVGRARNALLRSTSSLTHPGRRRQASLHVAKM
jgi:hypothetical protein